MLTEFHPIHTDIPKPQKFTFPFCYEPHPLCLLAAGEVQRYIAGVDKWRDELQHGKMFGVLVAEDEEARLGFTAAFSGLLDGSNDHPYFVPPVFDATPVDGYFKTNEARISAINHTIDGIEKGESYLIALHELESCKTETAAEEEQYRLKIKEAKAARDARRLNGAPITPEEEERMLNESRFMKAELHRMKKRNREQVDGCKARLKPFQDEIRQLKAKRKAMSDSLQHWLFEQYNMLNARGERRGLCSIFAKLMEHADQAFLIYHPALSYFAKDYGVKQISIEEGGKEPSPAHLQELIRTCRENQVRIIFVQQEFDVRNAELIAKELGVQVVSINPLSYHWKEEMLKVARALSNPDKNSGV